MKVLLNILMKKDWSMFIDNSDIAYLKNGYDAINVSYKRSRRIS